MSNNPRGNNQHGTKNYPSDEVLKASLEKYTSYGLTREKKLARLRTDHGLEISVRTLTHLQKQLGVATVRRPMKGRDELEEAVVDLVMKDTNMRQGPSAIKSRLKNKRTFVPRDLVRDIMREIAPMGFAIRFPDNTTVGPVRVPLDSLGPYHEVSADGHEKLDSKALQMGLISLPIYTYREKWSGYILKLEVLPDARKAGALGHVFLDLMSELGGVPIQMTTDMGSEIGWQYALQDSARRIFAPQIDPDVFPTFVTIKSVHNTVSESLWRFLSDNSGKNLKDAVLYGKEQHIFNPQSDFHCDLFYWIFIPLIQEALDEFRTYWNQHTVRPQPEKNMPSGHAPADALEYPEEYGGLPDLLVKVPKEAIEEYRRQLDEEVGTREEWLSWYTAEFAEIAEEAYEEIGSPEMDLDSAWEVFSLMAPVVRDKL
ncbi:hypothetical protein NMY22_g17986 [Coprinellus aureogranulatus]|nr:hypothetical protein NMY22_g17986 [Coprinellus aureogranulatus]